MVGPRSSPVRRAAFIVTLLCGAPLPPAMGGVEETGTTRPAVTAARAAGTALQAGATVRGTVHDSIARAPLAGAAVQLASADPRVAFGASVLTDARGRFGFTRVPDGDYLLGFQHALLDTLGVELPPRRITVRRGRPVRAELALPSATGLRSAICGDSVAVGAPVLSGIVRDAGAGTPLPGAEVVAEWLEVSLTMGAGMATARPRLVARTNARGFYALCGVPSPGSLRVVATRDADSTDVLEVVMPRDGFLRRELYLGPSRTTLLDAAPGGGDSTTGLVRQRRGGGRLTGAVVFGDAGIPLPNASVRILDGPQARTNAAGTFTLADLPEGTRLLEVRAVGYYPARLPVHVVRGAEPVRVALSLVRAVLDTVLVVAPYPDDKLRSGFADRRRLAIGRFLTSDEIARRRPVYTTDLFRNMQGVHLERGTDGALSLTIRGVFAARCQPNIYLNGGLLSTLDAETLDVLLPPERIAAVEVYTGAMVPAQFQPALNGCGSLVFWTK